MTYLDLDQVILVDENDNEIGVSDKTKAHLGKGLLHRAVSVFLFDEGGRLLIQQRSQSKIVAAGKWANTVCGNVRPGESYLDCARRRLKEELGIHGAEIIEIGKFKYQVSFDNGFSENEIDAVFVGYYHGVIQPNLEEVSDTAWIRIEDLKKNKQKYAPWVWEIMNQESIVKSLLRYVKN